MKNKIILTDWPKPRHIEAHYRGVETEKLVKIREQLFHTMMMDYVEEAGGYTILYNNRAIERELSYRNTYLEEL
jgi:hypothetical protein